MSRLKSFVSCIDDPQVNHQTVHNQRLISTQITIQYSHQLVFNRLYINWHVHVSLRGSPYPHMHPIDIQQHRSALLLCLLQLHPLVTVTPSGVAACFSCKQLHGVQHLSKNLHQQEAQCCVQCGVPTNRMRHCGKWSNTHRTRKMFVKQYKKSKRAITLHIAHAHTFAYVHTVGMELHYLRP